MPIATDRSAANTETTPEITMRTKEYTTIDRTGWPSGPWDNEPDKVQWQDEKTGLPCLAVRNRLSGNWCGYVGLSDGHPWYGKDYNSPDVDVHGGLTFAGMCRPGNTEAVGICHVPGPGQPDHVWWFGFDCAHAWDYSPLDVKMAEERGYPFTISHDASYRSLAYVRNECTKLASQLAQVHRER